MIWDEQAVSGIRAGQSRRTHKDKEGGEEKGEVVLFEQRVLYPGASLQSLEDGES